MPLCIILQSVFNDYYLANEVIERTDVIKNLEVLLDYEQNFKNHIDLIVAKSFKMLGFVNRSCKDFNSNTLKLVYCSLVISHLEYASLIWSPYYSVHIRIIESMQNAILRMCAFKFGLRWANILIDKRVRNLISLPTLEKTRIISYIILLSKQATM